MNKISIFICLLVAAATFTSCEKTSDLDFNTSTAAQAAIPVTVTNLYGMFNGVPTVSTSVAAGGNITITLAIPESSGRKIKEITRVALGTSVSNYIVVQKTTGLYNAAPIPGNNTTSVTFTTSLTEFVAKSGQTVPAAGTATSFLNRYYYFLLTLDNGQELMPVPVRVYVNA